MAKKKTDKLSDRQYSRLKTLRLSEEEYQQIDRFAKENRCTFSQALRLLLFKKKNDYSDSLSEETQNNLTLKHARALREKADKISSDIASISERYQRSLSLKNLAGEPAISTERTAGLIAGVNTRLTQMNELLGTVLSQMGVEFQNGEKNKSIIPDSSHPDGAVSDFRARIKGKISSSVETIQKEDGVRLGFMVTLSEQSSGKKYTYSVKVEAAPADISGKLTKGAVIEGTGDLHLEMRQNPMPSLNITLYAGAIRIIG